MGKGGDNTAQRCGCFGCLTILVIILFIASWSSLEYQEVRPPCTRLFPLTALPQFVV